MEKLNLQLIVQLIKKIKNFLYPLLDFYFPHLIKKDYIINTNDGIKFWIRPKGNKVVGDIDILIEILIEDQYQINNILKSNYKIVDIGGHVGFFSIFASRIIGKKGKIYVFEPFKPNFDQLMNNIKLNKIKNIIAHNIAISGIEREVNFFISKQNVGAHSLIKGITNEHIKVKSTTLKKIFQENNLEKIDLLKIDCEGCEYEILLRSPKNILKKIDTIILEQHITSNTEKYRAKSIIEYLRLEGFSVKILKEIYYEKEGNFFIVLAKRVNKKKNDSSNIRARSS